MGSLALLPRALALLSASRVLLGSRGTTTTLRRLSSYATATKVDPLDALAAVRRATKVVGGACLPQAVALTALLQRGGHRPVLVLGCHMGATGTWSAHAWVELDDLVLEPVPTVEHTTLARLSEENGWVPSEPDQS